MSHRDEFGGWRRFGVVTDYDEIDTLPVFWFVYIQTNFNVHIHIVSNYNVIELNPLIDDSDGAVYRFYILYPHWYTDSKPNPYERCAVPQYIIYVDGRPFKCKYDFLYGWTPN